MITQLRKIVLFWFLLAVIIAVGKTSNLDGDSESFASILVSETSALLAVATFLLSRMEMRKKTRAVFLNFSFYFLTGGLVYPLFKLISIGLFRGDAWLVFFLTEYQTMLYYLLLSISVIYLVLERTLRNLTIYQNYVAAFLIAGSVWVFVFGPYIIDPKHSYATLEIQDFRAIKSALYELRSNGIDTPTVAQISSIVKFEWMRDPSVVATQGTLEARILEILPYLRGENVSLLILRPFWWSCFWMSVLCLPFIVICTVHQYRSDPPGGAYVEKIVWCLLVYCVFEVLHLYACTRASEWTEVVGIQNLGFHITTVVMLGLLYLLILRMRFINSIEGIYYERRLIADASHITRWRDAFDTWVLRQFMNPKELERRFLIQSKDNTTNDTTHERP
jgi:hypothetical protein